MGKIKYRYCDSCVFLAYFNNEPDRAPILNQLFRIIEDDPETKLITSTFTIAEVTHTQREYSQRRLNPEIERQLDEFWANDDLLEIVDFHEMIAKEARRLVRFAVSKGFGLKPPDATHLATAKLIGVLDFLTYDDLRRYSEEVGFPIVIPYVEQPQLPGIED